MSIFELNQPTEKHEPEVCKALIANGDQGGCILEYIGDDLGEELKNVSTDLGDLGLDDAPDGISIWEGIISVARVGYDEWESYPKGTFRQLTASEWDRLKAGDLLWP